MKLKTSFVAIIVLTLMVIPLLSADTISGDNLEIKIYNIQNATTTINSTTTSTMTFRVYFISSNYVVNDKSFDFTVKVPSVAHTGNSTGTAVNSSNKLIKDYGTFGYLYVVGSGVGISVNLNASDALNLTKCNQDLLQCKSSVNGYSNSYNVCNNQLGNQSKLTSKLNNYNLTIAQNAIDLKAANDKITTLQNDATNSQNSKWIYALIGAFIGAGLLYWYKNKGGTARERSMNEFNKNQAG